jgi:hypothetical protein
VEHSNNVLRRLVVLSAEEDRRAGFQWFSTETLVVAALLHDVCKARLYNWNGGEMCYEYNPDALSMGHGEKSVFMVMKYMRLTDEEALAIRWHHGMYDPAAQQDPRELNRALEQSDLVLLLHMADMLASRFDEPR